VDEALTGAKFCDDIGLPSRPSSLLGDNIDTTATRVNPINSGCSNYIDIHWPPVREQTARGDRRAVWVPSGANVADIMTRPSGRVQFEKLRERLELR
jgi:hypothetical protein